MKKRLFSMFVFISVLSIPVFSQQITKFGVVDTAKVYNAYFRNSAPVRNFEKKKAEFQEEVNKLSDELKNLQQKKLKRLKIQLKKTHKKQSLILTKTSKNL